MKEKMIYKIKFFKKQIKLSFLIDVLMVSVTGLVLFLLIFFLRREQEWITLRLKVTDRDVFYAKNNPFNFYSHAFVKGDIQFNGIGNKIAEITGVEKFIANPSSQTIYLDISIKAIYDPRSKKYSFKGRPIIFGQPFIFEFSNVKVEGIVTNFPGFLDEIDVKEYKKIVKVQIEEESRDFSDVYGVRSFIAAAINIGDEYKNSNDEVLIKVIDKEVYPAKRTVFTDSGESFIISDLQLEDVYLTLEVKVKEINKKMYALDFVPLRVGEFLPLNFDKISLRPVITDILDD